MTISLMRTVDRYLGVFLCWVAGIPGILIRSRRAARMPADPQRVLIIKFFGMGSIILTTPAMTILRETYPSLALEFLTFEQNRELLERYLFINAIHTVRTASILQFVADTFRVLRELRRKKYDVVFDFEFFSKYSTLMSTFSRSAIRVGFSLPAGWRSLHLTHQVPLHKGEHASKAFSQQVFLLCGERPLPEVVPPVVGERDMESLEKKVPLNGNGIGRPVIAINVNAGETFIERRWPPERFASLVRSLAGELQYDFYFIGVSGESEYISKVIAAAGIPQRCYNVAGMLTIPELAALFRRAELLISSDSGPVHLAAAVGLRTVALYGPESPAFYGPTGPLAVTLTKSIPCSPCMNVYAAKSFRCPYDAACMKAIGAQEVLTLVEGVLEKV